MSSKIEYKSLNFEVSNIEDVKDILFYKQLEDSENIKIFVNENIITMKTKKPFLTNKGHISSVILSYSLINIIDVLKNVNINNVLQITADAITTLKPIDAPISSNIGEWKHEKKDIIHIEE